MLQKIKDLFINHSACFRKFWVYQFVISLLGVMVTLPLSLFVSNHPEYDVFPYIIAVVFCGGMFCFLVYDIMYNLGAKDYIRVQAKKAAFEPLKGLKICLVAYIPTFFIAILDAIFALFQWGSAFTITHVTLNVFIHAQYSGFMFLLPDSLGVIGDIVAVIFAPFFGFLGYYLAVHDKSIRGLLGIKIKRNKE